SRCVQYYADRHLLLDSKVGEMLHTSKSPLLPSSSSSSIGKPTIFPVSISGLLVTVISSLNWLTCMGLTRPPCMSLLVRWPRRVSSVAVALPLATLSQVGRSTSWISIYGCCLLGFRVSYMLVVVDWHRAICGVLS